MLHRQIHQWFVQGNQTSNLDALNEKVYAELFFTPSSDPWLGLAPDDVYSAIDNDGVKCQLSDKFILRLKPGYFVVIISPLPITNYQLPKLAGYQNSYPSKEISSPADFW